MGVALSAWAKLIESKEPDEARRKYEKAIECYSRALEINPNYAKVWYNKGNALSKLGRHEEAIECYDRVLEINQNFAAWYNKGVVLGELGRYEEEIECYDKALEINPNFAGALNNKGVALSKLRRYEEAIEYYNKALEINPNYAEAWYNKGNVLDELRKYEEAVELKGKAAFLLCLEGRMDIAFDIFKEVYDKRLNIPVCYECGVALASLLCLRNEVYDEIVADCNRNKDKICSSAKIVLKYLIDGEIEREIEVRDEKDAVFKVLLEMLTEME